MQPASKAKLTELQNIISKMPLQMCCVAALPEFGVKWRDVSRAIRNARLPMAAASAARVLSRHAAKWLPRPELDAVLARLRFKLLATTERKWYVINLQDPEEELSPAELVRELGDRVDQILRASKSRRGKVPEVQTATIGDLVYVSVRMVSQTRQGSALLLCAPAGAPVALVSSVSSSLVKACVNALGYKSFEDAHLFGRDIASLLRIHNRNANENPDHLTELPDYAPTPVVTQTGIDYTYQSYDENYVDNLLGPDPPLLTELQITSTKKFFDDNRLSKNITINIQVKSDDVAKSLKGWVRNRALAPTSDFFHIFHKVKCNRFEYGGEEE